MFAIRQPRLADETRPLKEIYLGHSRHDAENSLSGLSQ